jgi:hypothetical protein
LLSRGVGAGVSRSEPWQRAVDLASQLEHKGMGIIFPFGNEDGRIHLH